MKLRREAGRARDELELRSEVRKRAVQRHVVIEPKCAVVAASERMALGSSSGGGRRERRGPSSFAKRVPGPNVPVTDCQQRFSSPAVWLVEQAERGVPFVACGERAPRARELEMLGFGIVTSFADELAHSSMNGVCAFLRGHAPCQGCLWTSWA